MNGNSLWNRIKEKRMYWIVLFLSLIMIVGIWYVGEIGPFGNKCLVVVDGVHQYLPFFSEYQEKLKTLGSMKYTFNVGMGNNFLSLWSYYLSSPLNLIILLCNKTGLPMALNIIISVKLVLAALTFAYFLSHAGRKPEKNPGIIVFSLFYAFCSYVVGYYWNLMWLDCIYIFPLIILGMERMFTKKDSRLYVLSLLYSFICNYYISFMICMFLIIWFFTFRFASVKDFFMKGVRFAMTSVMAAAMGAAVLLPAYKGIMTTASAEFGFPEWEFYGTFADTLRSHLFCSEVMTNQVNDAGTNLYCGVFTILLAVMFFFVKDISLSKKIKYGLILVFFVISFNNQLLNYIWHGFHNQYGIPNRFAFLYVFLLLLMAYEVYLNRKKLRLYMIIIAYTISMLFVIFCYYHAEITYENKAYLTTGALLTIYLILFALYMEMPAYKWIPKYLLLIVAVFEMAVNGWFGFKQVGSSEPDYYYGETETMEALISRVEEQDEDLCRSDILQPKFVDEATWYNLKSIGIFGSTVRGELVDIMGDLGFYTGANEYLYYGATPVTNALFGVKYVYTRKNDFHNVDMEPLYSEGEFTVYRNENTLPIGYTVNQEMLTFHDDESGPFTVQNELAGAMTGIQPIFASIYEDMQTTTYGTNVQVTMRDDFNANYTGAGESARADIIYRIPYDMDLYISCRGSNLYKIALLIDGNECAYDRYQGQLFRVGEVKAGQLVDIQFCLNDGENMSGELYCYPMEFVDNQFQSFYDIMKSRGMEVTSYEDTKIEGKLHVEKGQIFMTSIPFDEGWSIYANGEKVETCALLDSFLGAQLEPGDYEITMKYRCPGLMTGAGISVIGMLCFLFMCRIENKKNNIYAREEKVYEN